MKISVKLVNRKEFLTVGQIHHWKAIDEAVEHQNQIAKDYSSH